MTTWSARVGTATKPNTTVSAHGCRGPRRAVSRLTGGCVRRRTASQCVKRIARCVAGRSTADLSAFRASRNSPTVSIFGEGLISPSPVHSAGYFAWFPRAFAHRALCAEEIRSLAAADSWYRLRLPPRNDPGSSVITLLSTAIASSNFRSRPSTCSRSCFNCSSTATRSAMHSPA